MSLPSATLGAAVITRLAADGVLSALVTAVLADWPADPETAQPYVVVLVQSDDWSTKEQPGEELRVSVAVIYGRAATPALAAVQTILERIKALLDKQEAALSASGLIILEFTHLETVPDPDGLGHDGLLEFTALMQQS